MGMKIKGKILVTGADGFIGSHLVEMLLAKGYDVRALCQYNSFNSWGWLEGVADERLEVVCGDVRDAAFCREITRGIDTVFHLAALIAIPYSYVAPQSYVDTNITGTLNICQGAKDNNVSRVVVTSTSEVYGTARYVPIDERHPRQPQSPYSATKIAADAIAMSFHNAFGLPVVLARPFNTYGPRQSARAIIPSIISQIAAGATSIKVGDMRPTRDFNFVEDTCRGFIALGEAEAEAVVGRDFNIATGTEISMEETFKTIARVMNSDVEFVVDPQRLRPAKSEVFRLCGDNSAIVKATGWRPQVSFYEGISRCVEWFTVAENLARYKTDIYNK
jgi:NAD dependent epimerase/dehydratase